MFTHVMALFTFHLSFQVLRHFANAWGDNTLHVDIYFVIFMHVQGMLYRYSRTYTRVLPQRSGIETVRIRMGRQNPSY
jgi:hypothetical protein